MQEVCLYWAYLSYSYLYDKKGISARPNAGADMPFENQVADLAFT